MNIQLQFDGASKGNPGLGGSGAVIIKNGILIDSISYTHKNRVTNNVAEYYGLLIGLRLLIKNNLSKENITIEGDSKLVIEQVFGKWKCIHPNLIPLCKEAKKLIMEYFPTINGKWIPREKNALADMCANKAIRNTQLTIEEAFSYKNKEYV
jgi:ribonuclease HI